jgi:hypothetical protein
MYPHHRKRIVTEHRIYKGWCSNCQKWHETPVDLHAEVLGQGRIGVRLASLVATLRTVMRLPIRKTRYLLGSSASSQDKSRRSCGVTSPHRFAYPTPCG